jgi:hypothetical protein
MTVSRFRTSRTGCLKTSRTLSGAPPTAVNYQVRRCPDVESPAPHHRRHRRKAPISEVAKSYGVARSWVYTLLARYQAEGEGAFEPRSRRPKTSSESDAPTPEPASCS